MLQADLIGIEHRAAAIDRPAIAIEPDHVDIARTRGDALFQYPRALVDHRIHHALEDFLVADDAALAAKPCQGLVDQLLDVRIGQRRARTALIFVVTLAGLLAEASGLAQRVRDLRLDAAILPRAPADIEAGEIAHRERSRTASSHWPARRSACRARPADASSPSRSRRCSDTRCCWQAPRRAWRIDRACRTLPS